MNYNFNIFDYIKQAVPFYLKKVKFLAYLQSLLVPIQLLNDDFGDFIPEARREATFTGQVIYLEQLLNDLYDDTLRRIYIDDGQANVLPPFIFNKIEERPLYLYNKSEGQPKFYLFNKAEFFISEDFIVFVPNSIISPALQTLIERQVDKYKIAGKTYTVQGF